MLCCITSATLKVIILAKMSVNSASPTAIFDLVNNSFEFQQKAVHSIVVKGDIWFRAKDICLILGYANTKQAIINNVSEKHVATLRQLSRVYETAPSSSYTQKQLDSKYIDEPGFYALVLRSQKPVARAFSEYVTDQVLPGIRKTLWEERQKELQKKNDKINNLEEELRQMREEIAQNRECIQSLQGDVDGILDTLTETADRAVLGPADDQLEEVAVLYRVDSDPDIGEFTHGVIRAQRRCVRNALSRKRKEHPGIEVIATVDPAPNSRKLFHKLKEDYSKEAYFRGNSIELFDLEKEPELIAEFHEVHEMRLEEAEECKERCKRIRHAPKIV